MQISGGTKTQKNEKNPRKMQRDSKEVESPLYEIKVRQCDTARLRSNQHQPNTKRDK